MSSDKSPIGIHDFAEWRAIARGHLLRNTPPAHLIWRPEEDTQQFLFVPQQPASPLHAGEIRLPRAFMDAAKIVARHRDASRWSLLYRIAWRIQNENRNLLFIETDDDIRALNVMRKAVEHDIYKMRAFVRFRRIGSPESEQYVAWYPPDHDTLDANERFFVNRFGGMRWAILTPDISMSWDLQQVHYGPGVPRLQAPSDDQMEDLWRAYYSSIYNPARLNLDAMRAQLPVRRWQDLPESRVIPELVRVSRGRVEQMAEKQTVPASSIIPTNATLPELRDANGRCSACELCGKATQAVPGEGPPDARIVLVGEQPGDEEDRAGRPFVGPAGQVLDRALREAGIDRASVYLTNAVKAFRFEERGKRRIHSSPKSFHITTCRPWLEAEVSIVRPSLIVCLGASAAQSVLGRAVRIQAERGRMTHQRWDADVLVTYHPSSILRAPEDARDSQFRALTDDLTLAARSVPY